MNKFKEYSQLNLSEVNKDVLRKWDDNQVFDKSLSLREGAPSYVFYEGPPSANGMPGIHHVMARSIKDIFCRYKTMKGYRVERKAGWDTHGLPVELGVEKLLGITKEDIGKKISVAEYNATCRKEVMKYTGEWESLTHKMGYWVDMNNPYITYDNRYIETLWWLLKQLYNKELLYKGYTIQPYSPAAGTGLSSHELNQPGCYRDVKDTTCVAQFKVKKLAEKIAHNAADNLYILAWTTTPWTLPSNTALCVGPSIEYVFVKTFNPYTGQAVTLVVAKPLMALVCNPKAAELHLADFKVGDKLIPFEVVGECVGSDLVGTTYEQLLPFVKVDGKAFEVISGDFVTTEDGTGIVHIAPTFGADDDRVAKKWGIAPLLMLDKDKNIRPMVDLTGRYFTIEDLDADFVQNNINMEEYKEWAGRYVKNAYDATLGEDAPTLDVDLCVQLKQRNLVYKIEKHTHNYPHCWRTDKPVLYYPLDSWFIRTTACRERMMELNETINWKPQSTGTGRFGKWLENLQDWNLSRSRYWGTPLPIWRTEDGSEELCVGSMEELMSEIEKAIAAGVMKENPFAGFEVGNNDKENYEKIDLHKSYVDAVVLVSDSGKPMRRESDLIDVWFDSGAMPYAQIHYPFENKERMDNGSLFPADFIAEGVDQTRGWFFTLHAIGTMVFDSVAFKAVVSNGLVLDKNGNKMSKRLGNAVDPFTTIEKYGSDPLRWYMMTNASPWDNLKFDIEGIDEVRRKFFGTLYNTYSFFALYANVDGFDVDTPQVPIGERPEIDRWILSLLNSLIREVDVAYDSYEPTRAGRAISDFVNDHLSNWYVRLNRKRYWGGEITTDKLAAYQTLYTCLRTVAQLMAPIAPFYADRLFLDLAGEDKVSVHLSTYPSLDEQLIDAGLERRMSVAQDVTSMVLALRRKVNIKVRQPLSSILLPISDSVLLNDIMQVKELILSEVNVKELKVVENSLGLLVKRIKVDFKKLGPKFGKQMKEVAARLSELTQEEIYEFEQKGIAIVQLSEQKATIELADVEIISEDMPGWLVANEGRLTVAMDVSLTDALIREGVARELVNRIQNLRKSSGLEITDRIIVRIEHHSALEGCLTEFADYVKIQTLTDEIRFEATLPEGVELAFDDFTVKCIVEVVSR